MSNHRLFAAIYDPVARMADKAGIGERRRRLLSGARGLVLEVGAGTGLNLTHYRDVDKVVLVEPDMAMRRRLAERLTAAAVPAELHDVTLEESAFDHATFDTVVCTFVLCSVADLPAALGRIRALLRPDGTLLFLEHVVGTGVRARFQRLTTPLWSRINAGCHLDRDTAEAVRQAGFVISDCERFRIALDPFTGTMVQGVARPRAEGRAA